MRQKEEILNYFQILKKRSYLGTAYIFVGEGFSLVLDIVKLINCQNNSYFCSSCWDCKRINEMKHPDLFLIEPEGLTIKIEAIREAIRFLSLKSFRLKNKVVIIKDAQNLNPASSNAFLKTLEEPPKNSFIILCTSKLEGLLPTVISRCRKIFLPFSDKKIDVLPSSLILSFLKGADITFKNRSNFSSFLWEFIILVHSSLIVRTGLANKRLPEIKEWAIVSKSYSQDYFYSLLGDLLKIYSVHNNVNMNLALNLIRMKIGILAKEVR